MASLPAADGVDVLEPVQHRERDPVGDREHLDALERLGERGCLDGHEQEPDRLGEALGHVGPGGSVRFTSA